MKYSVVLLVPLLFASSVQSATFFVATNGDDRNPGTQEKPFGSIEQALSAIRMARSKNESDPITVIVRGGTYTIRKPITLTPDHSGTAAARVTIRAAKGESPRFLAGRRITKWTKVTDTAILDRLHEKARPHIQQANLKTLGIKEFGSAGVGGCEFFFAGKPMILARWPNQGFVKITAVHGKTPVNVRGTKGTREGIFSYSGGRPSRWSKEQDAWVHGYWFWDWSEQRHPIQSIDNRQQRIEVRRPYHGYGYRKGQWFYAFNLLSELDQPGEWYVDRQRGILYFYPPTPIERSEATISVLPSMMEWRGASYITVRGFTFEGCRKNAMTVVAGTANEISHCVFRNIGGWGILVAQGRRHKIDSCDMYQLGAGGISVTAGIRKSLQPGKHLVINNHIHHYARVQRVYRPAIQLRGVGLHAAHNLIHDAPHMGMGFSGNDHIIEFNEMHDVCTESNDAGAIYTGRNWTMRGTVIRHNYLHHINGFRGRGCVGVYLDDMFCGTKVVGNVFYRVTRAAFIGGGRDNTVKNNLFVDCQPSLHIDARALGWAHGHSDEWIEEGTKKGTLSGIPFRRPPYNQRYPKLVNILREEPAAPKGNVVTHNVSFRGKWDGVRARARKYQTIRSNMVGVDPRFVTPKKLAPGKRPRATDFRLRADSPAWKIGFKKLPLSKIGLQRSRRDP